MSNDYPSDIPNPKDYECKPGESTDDCNKRSWAGAITYICGYAATFATAGSGEQAGFEACGEVAGVISYVTYPIIKAVLLPVGEWLGEAIMAIIPESWKAHETFCPVCSAGDLWAPVQQAWDSCIKSVNDAWTKGRQAHKLPAKPLKIDVDTVRNVLEAKLAIENQVVFGPGKSPGGSLPPPMASGDQPTTPHRTSYSDPEDLITVICKADMTPNSGWGVPCSIVSSIGGNGVSVSSGYPVTGGGKVADGPMCDPPYFPACGPFGLVFSPFPDDCQLDSDCLKAFQTMVSQAWSLRMQCLQRSMPYVIAAISKQITDEAVKAHGMAGVMSNALIFNENPAPGASTGISGWTLLLGAGVLTAGGWAAWKYWLKDEWAARKARAK